ncbi:MAG: FKBP-type peptidyl-prolyl cis-trans isomerase [Bacteroidota bacterium]
MKKSLSIIAVSGILALTACKDAGKGSSGEFKTEREKLGYAIGVDLGRNLEKAEIDSLDVDAMLTAMREVLTKKDIKMTDEESKKVITEFFQKKQTADAATKTTKAKKFFDENGKKAGVVTLESGLQYQIMKEGTGPKPTINDKVKVHYHGTLLDGKVFDSSVEQGQPAEFPVGGVITGWTEALQLMPVGSKWKVFIPSNLAYGERGAGGIIGPNEPLVFEVELLEILK